MNESEKNPNQESLNLPPNTDLAEAETEGAPAKEDKEAQTDEAQSDESALKLLRYQFGKLDLENQRLADENERLRDVHDLRKEYIPKLFGLTCVWLFIVVVFLWKVAQGYMFYLSDNVLIALITSTTVNVIGIFLIAAGWLFPKK